MRIGRYQVESKLGEGGMAETWLCRLNGAKGFSKRVVVKTLKADCRDPEHHTMFSDEARIGARLDHPNIARVLELGEVLGAPFIVQEFVDGPSVFQLLRRQKLVREFDLRLGCRVVCDIARALHFAYHATDDDDRPLHVVHRDVSPSNLLVARRGTTKLIDFGVAVFDDRETRTQAGVLKGKLRYMAPEVLLRDEVTHLSDVYSLGIILYGLCVGEPAWGGTDEVTERLKGVIVRPSVRRPDIDPHLENIILQCLQLDPLQRYPNGNALAADLEEWLASHGGSVSDEYVAERLSALFPDGPRDWHTGFDLTGFTSMTARGSVVPSSSNLWKWCWRWRR